VTSVPPLADDTLAPLRALVDELARELAADDHGGEHEAVLKQRIFLLHRAVQQHTELIETLRGDVRSLVDTWKEKFARGSEAPRPRPPRVTSEMPTLTATLDAPRARGTAVRAADSAAPAPELVVDIPARMPEPVIAINIAEPTPQPLAAVGSRTPSASSTPAGASTPIRGQPRVIDELNASTFVERGWSRIATGDFAGAQEALERALSLHPGDAHAETLLAWALRAQGKLDSSMALLQQVLDRAPDFALAHVNMGFVHLRRRHFVDATEHLTRAVALDSDRKATLYAHYYLGLVYFEQEQFAEAIGELLRAIELGPNLIEARFDLGRVLWFAERTDDAMAAWRKGAEVNKFNPWSARCRDMLTTIADGGAPSRVA
jgi:tetratricopeptide (TPR) repeat protein